MKEYIQKRETVNSTFPHARTSTQPPETNFGRLFVIGNLTFVVNPTNVSQQKPV
jgi:hypothetical protein